MVPSAAPILLPRDQKAFSTDPCSFLAGKLRVEYPGAIYHVMKRGDRRESTFHEPEWAQKLVDDCELRVVSESSSEERANFSADFFALVES